MKFKISIFFSLFFIVFANCQSTIKKDSDLLEKYYDLGVPTLNKGWSPEEYNKAINIVLEQNDKKLIELPKNSNNGIELLNKFTEYDNYWFLSSDNFTDNDKFIFISNYQGLLSKLMSCYYKDETNSVKLANSNEIIKCFIIVIKFVDIEISLMNTYNLSSIINQLIVSNLY